MLVKKLGANALLSMLCGFSEKMDQNSPSWIDDHLRFWPNLVI